MFLCFRTLTRRMNAATGFRSAKSTENRDRKDELPTGTCPESEFLSEPVSAGSRRTCRRAESPGGNPWICAQRLSPSY
jgi:hypothetical protein